jgi:toxin-antitoxin system PIN domain toxin
VILPDVNLLLYAHDSRGALFIPASRWWLRCLQSGEPIGLAWVVILGFLRISTNPRIYATPQTPAAALATVAEWISLPHFHLLNPSADHFKILNELVGELGTAGNLTTDAHLATLALEHGYILHTTDADFARFPKLNWVNPLREEKIF